MSLLVTIFYLLKFLGIIVPSFLGVAFLSVYERKVLSLMQLRLGPSKVFLKGFFQPFADALKLLGKEESFPEKASSFLFYLSPCVILSSGITMWCLFPSEGGSVSWFFSGFLLLFFFSISVYGVIIIGWYSSSKYASLGCIRSTVQSISYEIGLGVMIVFFCICYGSCSLESWLNPQRDIFSFTWLSTFSFIMSLILLVETNRSPFDLAEGESELVSGFCVEYGGVSYTMIFLGESLALLWASVLMSVIFFNGKVFGFGLALFLFIWARGTLPRIRFDKLMVLFWELILPVILVTVSIYIFFV